MLVLIPPIISGCTDHILAYYRSKCGICNGLLLYSVCNVAPKQVIVCNAGS